MSKPDDEICLHCYLAEFVREFMTTYPDYDPCKIPVDLAALLGGFIRYKFASDCYPTILEDTSKTIAMILAQPEADQPHVH